MTAATEDVRALVDHLRARRTRDFVAEEVNRLLGGDDRHDRTRRTVEACELLCDLGLLIQTPRYRGQKRRKTHYWVHVALFEMPNA